MLSAQHWLSLGHEECTVTKIGGSEEAAQCTDSFPTTDRILRASRAANWSERKPGGGGEYPSSDIILRTLSSSDMSI